MGFNIQNISKEEFISKHGSGTLRKATLLGMASHSMYLEERVCYEFGWEFIRVPTSRVTYGKPIAESDSKAVTEAGWHIERYLTLKSNDTEKFSCQYIIYENDEGIKKEGIGIKVDKSNSKCFNENFDIFAIVSEFNYEKGKWEEALNPF